jgi:hypothetical protein
MMHAPRKRPSMGTEASVGESNVHTRRPPTRNLGSIDLMREITLDGDILTTGRSDSHSPYLLGQLLFTEPHTAVRHRARESVSA